MAKPFELKSRKVSMFRCHLDPAIGPKAKNSFSKQEYPQWDMELTPIGVFVRAVYVVPGNKTEVHEHLVPYANVQSIKLFLEENRE